MLALLATAAVLAQTPNAYLNEGRRLFNELKYAEAIVQLEVARQVPGMAEAQAVEVLDLLARSEIAEGRRADAEKTYGELLLVSPSFTLDRNLSPKILEAFDAAKALVFPNDYLKLELLASAPGLARLRIIDPWRRAVSFELDARLEGEPTWRVEAVEPESGVLNLKLEAPPLRTLEWFVVARDANAEAVGGFGSAHAPQRLSVPPVAGAAMLSAPTPRLKRGLGWGLVAGFIAAGAVGALFQALSLGESHQAQDRTRLQFATDARALQSAAVRDATLATVCFVGAGLLAAGGAVVFAW